MASAFIEHRQTGRIHKVSDSTARMLCGENPGYIGMPRYRRTNAPRENVAAIMRENRSNV